MLFLHGNRLSSATELVRGISPLQDSLEHLTAWKPGEGSAGLAEASLSGEDISRLLANVWSLLPRLVSLNGWSRDGRVVPAPQPTGRLVLTL